MNNQATNPDTVRVLGINPVGKSKITYMFILVDFQPATGVKFAMDHAAYNGAKNKLTISVSSESTSNPNPPQSDVTYLAGVWLWQQDKDGNSIDFTKDINVEVSGTLNGNPVKKSGIYSSVKSVRDIDTDQPLETPRPLVIQSATNSSQYFIVSLAKLANTMSLEMAASTSGTTITLSGIANNGKYNNPNSNVASISVVPATSLDEYTTVTFGDNSVGIPTNNVTQL